MMQSLSHSTRAYIINANGLQGFVLKFEIIKALEREKKSGFLKQAKNAQVIDLKAVQA